jgi:hypothetical protein
VNQLYYISEILRNINAQTALLEMLDWEEENVVELLNIVSQTINETKSSSLILAVTNTLIQKGYSDDVVSYICEYITNITLSEKEQEHDC